MVYNDKDAVWPYLKKCIRIQTIKMQSTITITYTNMLNLKSPGVFVALCTAMKRKSRYLRFLHCIFLQIHNMKTQPFNICIIDLSVQKQNDSHDRKISSSRSINDLCFFFGMRGQNSSIVDFECSLTTYFVTADLTMNGLFS